MQFKQIENISVARDIIENLSTLHTKSRFSKYSLKGLCHAYTILRTKTKHKFLTDLNNKELNTFLTHYNEYIMIKNEDPKVYKALLHKPSSINDLLNKRKAWKNRDTTGPNPLMDMEAKSLSKTEIASFLNQDYCVYIISNEFLRIESEIHSIEELIPFNLMPLPEASQKWGLGESTLRGVLRRNTTLKENIDYRKSGHIYLITENAMKKLYGGPKK